MVAVAGAAPASPMGMVAAVSRHSGPSRAFLAFGFAVATLLLVVTATEGQCDAAAGPNCGIAEALTKVAEAPGDATDGTSTDRGVASGVEAPAAADGGPGNRTAVGGGRRRELDWAGIVGLCVVFLLLVFVVVWIAMTIKYTCDGSLAARMAMWGLLPEAYAAISVKSVIALLRMKKTSTPVIVLKNCVTDDGARELADAMRLYGNAQRADLQAIELPHNPGFSIEGARALVEAALAEDSKMEEFDFSYNPQLGGELVDVLKPLLRPRASKVNTLRLADCGLTPPDVQRLADALANSGLKTLDLSWNELGEGGEALASVLEAPVLEELAISCCNLRLEDVEAVAEMLPYTSLKSLQLGGNRLGPSGLNVVAENLGASRIDELGMESNDLEAADLAPLGTAWAKRPFSRVKLSGNQMTQEQVYDFVKTLRTIH